MPVKVLTETRLRTEFSGSVYPGEYHVLPGTVVTPAARSFLSDRGIKLVCQNDKSQNDLSGETSAIDGGKKKYHLIESNVEIDFKPEHFTHLRGNELVVKNNSRIKFRGCLDSLESEIILAQVRISDLGHERIVEDLQEILEAVKDILRAEVTGEGVSVNVLLGFSLDELRDISHYPEKYFSVKHFFPSKDDGEAMALLNQIRTRIRETELAACDAFSSVGAGFERKDILTLLNRLSSVLYVMMCKLKGGKY